MAASAYQKSCLLLGASLDIDYDAMKTLHSIYRLPAGYNRLPGYATVQAMEMLGVFSEECQVGLIDVPLALGMKSTHKKIKRKLKKVKYTSFGGIPRTQPRIEKIVSQVEETFSLLHRHLELLEVVMQTQYGVENGMKEVLEALASVSKEMEGSLHPSTKANTESHKTFDVPEEKHNIPTRFVRKHVVETRRRKGGDSSPLIDEEDNSTRPRLPTPNTKTKPIRFLPPSASNSPDKVEQGKKSMSLESDPVQQKKSERVQVSALAREISNKLQATPELKRPKEQVNKGSPGPATKPKPAKTRPSSTCTKVALLPPNRDSSRLSADYVQMSPIEDANENSKFPTHQYVNVGPGKKNIPNKVQLLQDNQPDSETSDTDDEYNDYETFSS